MIPRLLDLLEPPDFISLMNAGFGFIAVIAVAVDDLVIAGTLILVGAIADGLDGIVANRTTSGDLGKDIDSLGDAVSFGVAPALLAHYVARDISLVLSLVPIVFVLAVLVRLAAYNVKDAGEPDFTGVPSTFAGVTVVTLYLSDASALLGTEVEGLILVSVSVVLAYMMLVEIEYPEIREKHALGAGFVVALAVIFPTAYGAILPKVLLVALIGYLALSPEFYEGRK